MAKFDNCRSMSIRQTAAETAPNVTGEADFYDDLVIERYNYEFETDEANNSNSFTISTQQMIDNNIAGGLERNQVAELVSIFVPFVKLTPRDASSPVGSGPGTVRWDTTLQLLEQGNEPFDAIEVTDLDHDPDDDGSDEFVSANHNARKNRTHDQILLDWVGELNNLYKDATNGTGGGGDSNIHWGPYHRNFRQEFGRGPVAYPDWIVGANGNLVADDMPVNIAGKWHAVFYWDVMEIEQERTLRDIFVSN